MANYRLLRQTGDQVVAAVLAARVEPSLITFKSAGQAPCYSKCGPIWQGESFNTCSLCGGLLDFDSENGRRFSVDEFQPAQAFVGFHILGLGTGNHVGR